MSSVEPNNAASPRPKRDRPPVVAPETENLERLFTREEVAARYHVAPGWITRKGAKVLGLRPMKIGKRNLYPESQLVEADRRIRGEV